MPEPTAGKRGGKKESRRKEGNNLQCKRKTQNGGIKKGYNLKDPIWHLLYIICACIKRLFKQKKEVSTTQNSFPQ